jgi:hypoxia up-regulated 1
VELIGGASRIPRVISTISQFFNPVEVGTHINSDEAIAIGSVFHAANMSSAFRVKDIHVYDRLNLSIGVDIKDAEDNSLFSEEVFFKADDPVLLRR